MPHRYYSKQPLIKNSTVELNHEEKRHLKNVMRTRKGEQIEIVNGEGSLANATYNDIIKIDKVKTVSRDKSRRQLALSISESKHLEFVIEKCTELGVDKYLIFPSLKSKFKTLSTGRQERLKRILISSLKQSKRLYLPEIELYNRKEDLPKEENYFLADFSGKTFSSQNVSTTFIIGPEGGFTKDEIIFFTQDLKAKPTLLSKNILRCETAAICAATLLSL